MNAPVPGHAPTAPPAFPLWVWGLVAVGCVAVAYVGRSLLMPLLSALLLAYLLNPIVLRLQARGVHRGWAVLLLLLALPVAPGGLVVLRFSTVQAETQHLITEAPAFVARVEAALDRATADAKLAWPVVAGLLPEAREPGWLQAAVAERLGEAPELAGRAGDVLMFLVLVPVFAFFLLRDGPSLVDTVVGRMHPRHIETSVAVWAEIDQIIGSYLRGLALESLGVGLLAGLGLWLLDVPLPFVLGLFAALVNPLPYIGVVMSLGLALVVALTSQMSVGSLGVIVILFGVIRLVDDLVLIPLTIGRSVHLHPLLTIVAILVGEHALGVLGMVLAVPTVTVIKELTRLLLEHRRTLSRGHDHWAYQARSGHVPL